MSSLTRRTWRAAALCAVLGLATLSLGPGAAAAGEQASPALTLTLPFGFYIGDDQQPTTSHVAKLGSDIVFPQGRFDGVLVDDKISGKLLIPTTSSYFVAFRFMPATGTVELVPDGDAAGTAKIKSAPDETGTGLRAVTDVTARVFIKLTAVRVAGKPLDVGDGCRTAQPAVVNIKAVLPLAAPKEGQPRPSTRVTSTFDTPPFAGCGVTEDLSPLLTGLVAGPGNTLLTNLALRCTSSGPPPNGCGK
ncbi:hypothetical protein [Amycolatopsis sp. H20-H5]|uniref:hypothetical protein n=1 Tax=Amycolatopsis sp. H20-H5 TaxID=3046309 RepID=UPI002DB7BE97|nr:hypothetical protein [Amycolatopsis sp. H20-H5]MEC3982418.1 hypothetical protein [Amycolatopsis sp. H20-H5]